MISGHSESFPGTLPTNVDVLIVGAGAAGLYTSLCLPNDLAIALVTKEPLSLSASDWAQGGIAAVTDPQDSPDLHIQDTLNAGAGLCDYQAVKFLVENAPQCIQTLVEMGVGFDRHDGKLALTLEAAHSRRRVLHAADTTGRAVVSTLASHVLTRENIHVIQGFVLDLWLDDQTKRCLGASVLFDQQISWLRAKVVILATGGGGQVFAQTTNPALSTGDGVAIAHRANAVLQDLEFVQFHPTALTKPGVPHFLISEAVRGEGAHLVDASGYRFAFDYHPSGELAPRDVVSRAIFNHLQKTASDPATATVWLDLRPISVDRIQQRFPNIIQVCQQWGIDVFTQPIPVAPAAHYWMGGIVTDLMNQTSIPGLYAVGETASTGVHGANRLASNSLLECLVFGAQFARLSVGEGGGEGRGGDEEVSLRRERSVEREWMSGRVHKIPSTPSPRHSVPPSFSLSPNTLIQTLRADLPRLVWQSAGICREQHRLEAAIAQLETWQQEFTALAITQQLQNLAPQQVVQLTDAEEERLVRNWAEIRNLMEIADLILRSAHFRTESRGGHYRSDYPETDSAWQVHTLVQGDRWWTGAVDSANF